MLIVDKHCCDEFPVPQIDHKNKQTKGQQHGKFYLQSVSVHAILNVENLKTCKRITKLEAIEMQFVCIFFHIYWISAANLNFQCLKVV